MHRWRIALPVALAVAALPLAAGGTEPGARDSAVMDREAPEAGTKRPSDYDADNTGTNVRDRDDAAVTPGDQGSSDTDLRLTREIRRAVTDDDALSVNAQNVKIVTRDGVVTLRGPVDSPQEKDQVAAKAAAVSGVKRVDNQLEVNRR
jgi:hyperosmotically inducible periplasmic protein